MSRVPQRRCISCRQVFDKGKLLRLVFCNGLLQADWQAKMSGRGAYVHSTKECLNILKAKPLQLDRAFRTKVWSEQVVKLVNEALKVI